MFLIWVELVTGVVLLKRVVFVVLSNSKETGRRLALPSNGLSGLALKPTNMPLLSCAPPSQKHKAVSGPMASGDEVTPDVCEVTFPVAAAHCGMVSPAPHGARGNAALKNRFQSF